jgi:predicted ATPase
MDRAQAVHPGFALGGDTRAAVAELCERLEGLPLAIELAAARVPVLAPARMIERLGERLDLLTAPPRDAPRRHRSLRSALDWSYRLLSPELQRFFACLSVFQGGWTVEAAAAVCDDPLALDRLAQLEECSLIESEHVGNGEIRFRMLETLREFAGEQLTGQIASGLGREHARYYLQLAVASDWLQGLERELGNLLKALAFLAASEDVDAGLELGWELCFGLHSHSYWHAIRTAGTRHGRTACRRRVFSPTDCESSSGRSSSIPRGWRSIASLATREGSSRF